MTQETNAKFDTSLSKAFQTYLTQKPSILNKSSLFY